MMGERGLAKRGLKRTAASVDRRRLGSTPFCLISDNCWGAEVYRHLGRPYNTPFVGLFVPAEDYLRLVFDLAGYLELPLGFRREPGDSSGRAYPVGLLGDVEVHFLHYPSAEEAQRTWRRRVARIDLDHVAVTFHGPADERADRLVGEFMGLPFARKVVFSQRAAPNVIHVPDWHWSRMFEETQRVFDAVGWLRGEPARPAPLARVLYR